MHLPLVLPPVVTGYVLLLSFGRKGPVGSFLENTFGISFAFNWTGAALAAGVMAFPLMVRPIRISFEAVDPKLEDAAKSLGAHRLIAFLTITLPLALPGILGGAILGFAKAMGEFGATITFVSNIPGETRTLALALYTATQTPSGDLAAFRLTLIAACGGLCRPDCLRAAGPPAAQNAWEAVMLDVDITGRVGALELQATFHKQRAG